MIQNIILPEIVLAQDFVVYTQKENVMQGGKCIVETPYRDTTVFGSHDPKYYTASDWLGPGTTNDAIQGAHCVLETPYRKTHCVWIP